ncbi:MAG: chlorite dismutase family protein [Chloroflexota bacterium]
MNAIPAPTYAAYWLLKARASWQQLDEGERRAARQEYLAALAARPSALTLRGVYSLAGYRADADLMFWLHGPEFADIQTLATALRRTLLGAHLDWVYVYTGAATPAQYDPTHSAAFLQDAAPKGYLSVYPFIKTPEWYLLSFEERRALMADHGRLGRQFSVPRAELAAAGGQGGATAVAVQEATTGGGVLTNTVHSFGLGDQEFVVAFESDDAFEMVRMVEALRSTEVRRYTKLDTPIFLGRRKTADEALGDLG